MNKQTDTYMRLFYSEIYSNMFPSEKSPHPEIVILKFISQI